MTEVRTTQAEAVQSAQDALQLGLVTHFPPEDGLDREIWVGAADLLQQGSRH